MKQILLPILTIAAASTVGACLLIDDFSDVRSSGSGGASSKASAGASPTTPSVTSASQAPSSGNPTSGNASGNPSGTSHTASTGTLGECKNGISDGVCQPGEKCQVCPDCNDPADCGGASCNKDNVCNLGGDDKMCACSDCIDDPNCTNCHDDGVCNFAFESCNCMDCIPSGVPCPP